MSKKALDLVNGHGGRRPGAGRPKGSKSKLTKLREAKARELIEAGAGLLPAMFSALAEIALDPEVPPAVRVKAAVAFMDRICGRPAPFSRWALEGTQEVLGAPGPGASMADYERQEGAKGRSRLKV